MTTYRLASNMLGRCLLLVCAAAVGLGAGCSKSTDAFSAAGGSRSDALSGAVDVPESLGWDAGKANGPSATFDVPEDPPRSDSRSDIVTAPVDVPADAPKGSGISDAASFPQDLVNSTGTPTGTATSTGTMTGTTTTTTPTDTGTDTIAIQDATTDTGMGSRDLQADTMFPDSLGPGLDSTPQLCPTPSSEPVAFPGGVPVNPDGTQPQIYLIVTAGGSVEEYNTSSPYNYRDPNGCDISSGNLITHNICNCDPNTCVYQKESLVGFQYVYSPWTPCCPVMASINECTPLPNHGGESCQMVQYIESWTACGAGTY